jgi:hypothetical protein
MKPTLVTEQAAVPHQHIIGCKPGLVATYTLTPSPWSTPCICSRCVVWQSAWRIVVVRRLYPLVQEGWHTPTARRRCCSWRGSRTLWRLSYRDMHDWLRAWPALALACGLPLGRDGQLRIPSPSQQCKRGQRAGAPGPEALFFLSVLTAIRSRLIGARDLIIDSAPILAWRRSDPDAAVGHALGECILARSWRGRCTSTTFAHASSAWTPAIGGCASSAGSMPPSTLLPSSPGTPNASRTAPACLRLGPRRNWARRSAIERFFDRVFLFFHLQRPPLCGWSAIARQVALTYTASIIVALAAQQADRPDLIRSPKRVLAHTWEGWES